MAEAWQKYGPQGWEIETLEITSSLPTMMEDPLEFLPPDIPKADLVISLGEHPGVAELLPEIVKAAGARAVIAPVDNRAWLPPRPGQTTGEGPSENGCPGRLSGHLLRAPGG